MKTTRTLTLAGLFLSILVMVSCHKNDVVNTDVSETISGKAVSTNNIESSTSTDALPDCNSHCITAEGPFVEATGSQMHYYGNPSRPHSKTVSYIAYNTPSSFIVKVSFVHSGGNTSDLVRVTALGTSQSVATLASGATQTFTFTLPNGWAACDNVPFAIHQEGQSSPIDISASYNLYGICAAKGCETSFTGEAMDCGTEREAVYTFIAKEDQSYIKIQGGLTNFTGANAEVIVDGGSLTDSQSTPGGSSNRVIKVEGSVTACEVITITIKWNSTNSGGIITGSWSVKDANGAELAPAVAGLTCGN